MPQKKAPRDEMARFGEPEANQMIADWQHLVELYRQDGNTAKVTQLERLIGQMQAILATGLSTAKLKTIQVRQL